MLFCLSRRDKNFHFEKFPCGQSCGVLNWWARLDSRLCHELFSSRFQSEKKGLSRVIKTQGVQPLPWWCSGQGCDAQSLRSENRFRAWAPSSLNNHKVSWLKSGRKGLDKIEKTR